MQRVTNFLTQITPPVAHPKIHHVEHSVHLPGSYHGTHKYHHVSDPELVEKVLGDADAFSSLIPRLRCPMKAAWDKSTKWFINQTKNYLIHSDGKRHKCLRKAFEKDKMVPDLVRRRYRPWLEKTVEMLIERAVERERSGDATGKIDVYDDVSEELADRVLCKVLGFDDPTPSLLHNLRRWAIVVVKELGGKFEPGPQHEAFMESHGFFRSVLERYSDATRSGEAFEKLETDGFSKVNPDGVIGKLVANKKIAGHHDLDDLATQCVLWMGGGSHNPAILSCMTVGLLGQNQSNLEEFRRRYQLCRDDPKGRQALLTNLSTEVLRAAGPAEVLIRVATKPVELWPGRPAVRVGDAVVVHLQEASYKLVGPGPEGKTFDPFRVPVKRKRAGMRPHYAFGFGPHRCMGGELGQCMAEVMVEKLYLSESGPLANSRLSKFVWKREGTFKQVKACYVVMEQASL